MSTPLDNGFAKAQADYERQLPPGSDDVECPECEDEGTIPTSMCCDAEVRNGMCMNCAEKADYSVCPTCLGKKEIDPMEAMVYKQQFNNEPERNEDE